MELFLDNKVADFLVRCEDFIKANPALNNEILANCAILSLPNQKLSPVTFISCFEGDHCVGAFLKLINLQLNIVANSSIQAISKVVDVLIEKEISIGRCFGACSEEFVQCWQRKIGDNFNLHRTLIAYELSTISDYDDLAGEVRQATLNDLDIVVNWRKNFLLEVGERYDEKQARVDVLRWITRKECFLLEDNGRPCSMINAFNVGYDLIRIGAVYTPKNLRGRGYSKSLVQQISAFKVAQGERCILDADLNNPISNHIYQKLGYVRVGELRDYIRL